MELTNCSKFRYEIRIFVLFGMMSLQFLIVCSYPLGFEARGVGIHQGQPSYLPANNGIFSIHALNFTPTAFEKTENYIHVGNQESFVNYVSNITLENAATTNELPTTLTEKDEIDDQPSNGLNDHLDDGTDSNEVDSPANNKDDPPKVAELLATFPQTQVVTKTISEETFQPTTSTTTVSSEDTTATTVEEELARHEVTVTVEISLDESHSYNHSNKSETLLSGSEEDPVETDGKQDIFDNFIEPIQNVWQEFVSKLKMSVLEVWKSISHHLMERLESFATNP